MKLSISNIGWQANQDIQVYDLMKKYGYQGLEIAPTRIFEDTPYDRNIDANAWYKSLKRKYGFSISSMQSIWFGRQEQIFGSEEERQTLINYTKKAIDFATTINCKNLVFGCPKNRNIPDKADENISIAFFREIGDYAFEHNTTVSIEANPPIYNTNYINDTMSALYLIKAVESKGFLLNLDVGTMIQNYESVSILEGNVNLINHVHISEPYLKPIEERKLHYELKKILSSENYEGYVSIEMGKVEDLKIIDSKLQYVKRIFKDI